MTHYETLKAIKTGHADDFRTKILADSMAVEKVPQPIMLTDGTELKTADNEPVKTRR